MTESYTADKGQPTESELHLHTEDSAHLRNFHGTIAVKIKYTKNYQTTTMMMVTTTATAAAATASGLTSSHPTPTN
jgi:hypothetical protein